MLWEGVREPWQVWKLNAVLSHNPNPPQGIALPCCLAAQALMESSPERGKDSPENPQSPSVKADIPSQVSSTFTPEGPTQPAQHQLKSPSWVSFPNGREEGN